MCDDWYVVECVIVGSDDESYDPNEDGDAEGNDDEDDDDDDDDDDEDGVLTSVFAYVVIAL